MGTQKRITVLLSVYNGEKFIRQAIDSILSQTYNDFDFVIYDDCSTDNTQDIIKSYEDSRIVYRRNEINQGLTKNLADGVYKAETEYIARMDADDIAYPNRLETQILWMDAHPEISVLGTPVSYFHEIPGDGSIAVQPIDDATIKATLLISFTLMHPSIIIRKKDLVLHNINYNPDFRCSQDHALYLDCIQHGLKFANLSIPLLFMRSHATSISRSKHEIQQGYSQRARLIFLKATGIASNCTEEEIDAYNSFASGYFPDTIEKVHLYERFVNKIYDNPQLTKYFDKELVLYLMATKLCDGAYHAIDDKDLRKSAIAAKRSSLRPFSKKWSLKMEIKFLIKMLITI